MYNIVIKLIFQKQSVKSIPKKSFSVASNLYTKSKPRPVFDRKSKQLQKCRAAISPNISIYEYLKEEVCKKTSTF